MKNSAHRIYYTRNMSETKVSRLAPSETLMMRNEIMNLRHELEVRGFEIVRLKYENNRFVRMVVHDLQNPLGVILSFAEFLADDIDHSLSENQKDFVGRIQNSAEFISALLSDLADVSVMETGQATCNISTVNIHQVVSDCIKRRWLQASEKEIKIRFEFVETRINMPGDAERLGKVFDNLLSNAIKFSHQGGEVIVALRKESGNVRISVSDSGMGIAPENQKKIFVAFDKVSRKGTNGEKGTGLGLAISKRIVEEHQGKILVESEPGKGSSFIVLLPLE